MALTRTAAALGCFLCLLVLALGQNSSTCPYSNPNSFTVDIFQYLITQDIEKANSLVPAPFVSGVDETMPSFAFKGAGTGFHVSELSKAIRTASCSHNEVTFFGRIYIQDSQSDGPLLELSYGAGLQQGLAVFLFHMDAAADEIILSYRHLGRLHSESFPVRLISGKWRNYAISLSGNLLSFYFDCQLHGQRVVPLPDYCANDSSVVVSVASSMNNALEYSGHMGLYVFMQKVGFHFGPGGIKIQCPATPELCPSCGQFLSLLEQLSAKDEEVLALQSRVKELEERETCPTIPTPPLGGIDCIVQDGNSLKVVKNREFLYINSTQEICFCNSGNEVCSALRGVPVSVPACEADTPSTTAADRNEPDLTSNAQMPQGTCFVEDLNIDIIEGFIATQHNMEQQQCNLYICEDLGFGLFTNQETRDCVNMSCPGANTPREQATMTCCGFCDACDFETCPENNECVLQDSPSGASCVCKNGFSKLLDDSCTDINECSLGRGPPPRGHNCPQNSDCINSEGSFSCQCHPGYLLDAGNIECLDIDECSNNTHNCTEAGTCVNTAGGFFCNCTEGYVLGPDRVCEAVCSTPCENGGVCSSPDTCTCPPGFTGDYCESDLDECMAPGLNSCHEHRQCVNTVGGYFCNCAPGYQLEGSNCVDVDECSLRIHNCVGHDATCRNTLGGFLCLCNDRINCTGSCVRRTVRYQNGESFFNNDTCRTCTCVGGEIMCKKLECDCSMAADYPKKCCPNCPNNRRDCFILNDSITIRPGNAWINPANRCHRYDCFQNLTAVFKDLSESCPQLDCPQQMQTIPTGKCCPVCMLPVCDSSTVGRVFTMRNGCQHYTCDGIRWSFTGKTRCPEPTVTCDARDIVFYRDGCCPVCRQEILDNTATQCFTATQD